MIKFVCDLCRAPAEYGLFKGSDSIFAFPLSAREYYSQKDRHICKSCAAKIGLDDEKEEPDDIAGCHRAHNANDIDSIAQERENANDETEN